jgi:hypothetical protein
MFYFVSTIVCAVLSFLGAYVLVPDFAALSILNLVFLGLGLLVLYGLVFGLLEQITGSQKTRKGNSWAYETLNNLGFDRAPRITDAQDLINYYGKNMNPVFEHMNPKAVLAIMKPYVAGIDEMNDFSALEGVSRFLRSYVAVPVVMQAIHENAALKRSFVAMYKFCNTKFLRVCKAKYDSCVALHNDDLESFRSMLDEA